MINKLVENKRYTTDNGSNEDVCLVDNLTGKEYVSDFDEIVDLLNEQEEQLTPLKSILWNTNMANARLKERIKELEKEIKRLNCINKQLEDRLGGDVALDMDCGDV